MRRQGFRLLTGSGTFLLLMSVTSAAELEMRHPDFHARLGMRLYAVVGEGSGKAELKASLTGPAGTKVILDKKNTLAKEEVITLDLRELPKGKYALKVELLDDSGEVLKAASREWEKTYDGIPRVGLDENNAVCVGGRLFFPLMCKGIDGDENVKKWSAYANTLKHVGFAEKCYTPEGFQGWMDTAAEVIDPNEVRRWTDLCHQLDSQHLVFCNVSGEPFARPKGNWAYNRIRSYTYLFGPRDGSGRRALIADVISQDYYPIEDANKNAERGYPVTVSAKGGGRVDSLARKGPDGVYLFAANIRREPATATFTLDFAPGKIEVFDEGRQRQPDGRTFSDDFAPLAVHIYKVTK